MSLQPQARDLIVLFVAAFCALDGSKAQVIQSIGEQRQKLITERDEAVLYFDAQDAQCKNKFAVTGCLNDVNRLRLVRLAAIKKAENHLQDAERLQRGAEQRQQLEDRAVARERQSKEAVDARLVDADTPLPLDKKAVKTPAEQPWLDKPSGTSSSPKLGINDVLQRDNRKTYEAKQLEAEKKRVERDKRLREQKSPVPGLPASPLSAP
jgi:colicin import membrane protein